MLPLFRLAEADRAYNSETGGSLVPSRCGPLAQQAAREIIRDGIGAEVAETVSDGMRLACFARGDCGRASACSGSAPGQRAASEAPDGERGAGSRHAAEPR